MNRRVVLVIVAVVVLLIVAFVGGIAMIVLSVFKFLDRSDAHVCALAAVRHSPAAIEMLGEPIEQRGFTGGSTNNDNGELTEHITFDVAGPRGQASVVADGKRSAVESQLVVKFGRNGEGQILYSGKFDCPDLHQAP